MNQEQYDLMFRLLIEGSTSLYLKGEKDMTSVTATLCMALLDALMPDERDKLRITVRKAGDAVLSQYRSEVDL